MVQTAYGQCTPYGDDEDRRAAAARLRCGDDARRSRWPMPETTIRYNDVIVTQP